ncbi:MAG TPA: hypothetical protein VF469_38970 [Kofleriaceae bacterium]
MRSLRVAVALCDRFAEILRGPSQVTARQREGSLFGFSGNQDEFSLRIGEAQQIYPEIWRHLDDARNAFAARGAVVGGYDAVRAEEGQRLGAAVDVQHARHGFGRYAVHEQVKSANFNWAGLGRARRACEALMRATPQIDWAAIAQAEAHDPAVAAFGRALRRKRIVMLGLVAVAIASPFLIVIYLNHREREKVEARKRGGDEPVVASLTDAERSELTAAVAKRRAGVARARQAWATIASADALGALVPGSRPCALPIHAPPDAAAEAFIRTGDVDAAAFDPSAFQSYVAAPDGLPDTDLQRADRVLAAIDGRLAAGKADATDRAWLAGLAPYSTTVLIDKDVEPVITQTAPPVTYEPGEVAGRAYVFSLADGKFVCAATVGARNPPSADEPKFLEDVRRAPDARVRLHRELEVGIRRSLAANLKAIEP